MTERRSAGLHRRTSGVCRTRFDGCESAAPTIPAQLLIAALVVLLLPAAGLSRRLARAACLAARARGAGHIVFAAPVGAPGSVRAIGEVADEVVCVSTPERLSSVGWCYADFTPVTDEDVETLLHAPASG